MATQKNTISILLLLVLLGLISSYQIRPVEARSLLSDPNGQLDSKELEDALKSDESREFLDDDEGSSEQADERELPKHDDFEGASESSIANAKVNLNSADLETAAGHHHHHGHYPHGMLKMGAHTGKKGSFGWHDKHPVGGKGRR